MGVANYCKKENPRDRKGGVFFGYCTQYHFNIKKGDDEGPNCLKSKKGGSLEKGTAGSLIGGVPGKIAQ